MASGGNFPVLNPLYRGQRGTNANFYGIIEEGNTNIRSRSNNDALTVSTFEGLKSGKWYWEWSLINPSGDLLMHSGAADSNRANWDYVASSASYGAETSIHFHTYNQIVEKNGTDTGAYSSSASSHSTGDVFGIALDTDNGKFYVHKNGTYYASGNPATGANPGATWTAASEYTDGFTPYFTASGGTAANGHINFGQDSTFGGRITAGGNTDENGFGDFKYSPPSGFLALCSANLPIDENIDPAQGSFPLEHCAHGIYSGTGTAQNITGLDFQPDCVWISQRSTNTTANNYQFDSTSGVNKYVQLNSNIALTDDANTLTAFNSDGFSIGSDSNTNNSTDTYSFVAWKANGGTTSTNTDGTIASTVQVNQAAGFSIVQYNGGNGTVGHGLGKAPKWIIARPLASGTLASVTYHPNQGANQTGGELGYLHLSANQQFADYNAIWQDTVPSATVVTVGTAGNVNDSNGVQLMCWAEIEGYSKMGTYKGNASDDGPFVYCGFRPQVIILKNAAGNDDWGMYTQAINDDENNDDGSQLQRLESTNGEQGGTGRRLDFLSSGFKLRTSNSTFNSTSGHYIFIAYGDNPFKYANTF